MDAKTLAGHRVLVDGVKSRPELNGKEALVLNVVPEKPGRAAVQFRTDTTKGVELPIKPLALNIRCLKPKDWLAELLRGKKFSDRCEQYVDQIMQKAAVKNCSPHTPIPSNLWDIFKAVPMGSVQLISFHLHGFGRSCIIEVERMDEERFYGRMLQSSVKGPAVRNGKVVTAGYNGLEWLKSESCRWWKTQELKNFCSLVSKLQNMVNQLVEEELLPQLQGTGVITKAQKQRWTQHVLDNIQSLGLTMQPSCLEQFTSYAEDLRKTGYPEHMVIFQGANTATPTQLLDFPLEKYARPIFECFYAIFREYPRGQEFINAVNMHGEPSAWTFSVADIQRQLVNRS